MKTHKRRTKRRRVRRTQRAGMFEWMRTQRRTIPKVPPPKPETIAGPLTREETFKLTCIDTNACMLFGREFSAMISFFEGFTLDGENEITKTIKLLGNDTTNGLVAQIKFTKEGLDAYALLKKPQFESRDSVWYEYLMGKQINKNNLLVFLFSKGLIFYKKVNFYFFQ